MLKSKSAKVPDLLHQERFDVAAQQLFKDISRKKIKAIIDQGGAYLNKKRITIAKFQVHVGDKIEIFWEEQVQEREKSDKEVLKKNIVIAENENFFIINKPAGIASQATLTSSHNTIIHTLCAYDPLKFNAKDLFLVHRLDKDTSGLMIIARNKIFQKKFELLFHEKKIAKEYTALCFGTLKNTKGKISFPIAKDLTRKNCYMAVTNPHSRMANSAKSAETDYRVTKVYAKGETSLISCSPKTGRTHQIRVHFAAVGCPILGDKTYAQNIYGSPFAQLALRHMLHAYKISFTLDGKHFEFEAPLPEDFMRVIKSLELST